MWIKKGIERMKNGKKDELIEKGFRWRRKKESMEMRVFKIKIDRIKIGIESMVIREVDLDEMEIRVEKIEEEGIGNEVEEGKEIDIGKKEGGGNEVEKVDDVERCRKKERGMVKERKIEIGEGDIVKEEIEVSKGGKKEESLGIIGILSKEEKKIVIEGEGLIKIRREEVEVVDEKRIKEIVERIFLMDRRKEVNYGIEIKRNEVRIKSEKSERMVG